MSKQLIITLSEAATSRYLEICDTLNDESNDMRIIVDISTPSYFGDTVKVGDEEIGEVTISFADKNI